VAHSVSAYGQKPLITFHEISVTVESNYFLALLSVLGETDITTFGRPFSDTTDRQTDTQTGQTDNEPVA